MATVLIATYGSRGDTMPLTDIGARLRDAGHRVVLTCNDEIVDEVAACGFEARGISFDVDTSAEADPIKAATQLIKPAGIRALGNTFLDVTGDLDIDLALLTPFTELPGHALAEARGVAALDVRLQPMSATSAYPPTVLGAWSAGGVINRAAGTLAACVVDRMYQGAVADFRRRLNLPSRTAATLRKQRTASNLPILHGYSPSVLPRPDDWRPGLEVVGYWWPQTDPDWSPPDNLTAFLSEGAPPVFVGFGSLMVSKAERDRLSRVVHEAAVTAGVRAIVQSGGAGLAVPDDEHTLTIGTVPHGWLFEQVAAVVHSCGAGTTAAGLRAGLPAVGVPSPGGDQPFWAKRLHTLGVSPAPLPRPKVSAESLAAAITSAVSITQYRKRAEELSQQIQSEDGAAAVTREVRRVLER